MSVWTWAGLPDQRPARLVSLVVDYVLIKIVIKQANGLQETSQRVGRWGLPRGAARRLAVLTRNIGSMSWENAISLVLCSGCLSGAGTIGERLLGMQRRTPFSTERLTAGTRQHLLAVFSLWRIGVNHLISRRSGWDASVMRSSRLLKWAKKGFMTVCIMYRSLDLCVAALYWCGLSRFLTVGEGLCQVVVFQRRVQNAWPSQRMSKSFSAALMVYSIVQLSQIWLVPIYVRLVRAMGGGKGLLARAIHMHNVKGQARRRDGVGRIWAPDVSLQSQDPYWEIYRHGIVPAMRIALGADDIWSKARDVLLVALLHSLTRRVVGLSPVAEVGSQVCAVGTWSETWRNPRELVMQTHERDMAASYKVGSEDGGRGIECMLCSDTIQSPGILDCGHVGCYSCMVRAVGTSGHCPVCRKPFCTRDIMTVYDWNR